MEEEPVGVEAVVVEMRVKRGVKGEGGCGFEWAVAIVEVVVYTEDHILEDVGWGVAWLGVID